MRALRFHAKEDVRVEEVDEPTPGPGQVKLRNGYSHLWRRASFVRPPRQ
jgi:(R,R)-butanediol dehydrogenase/meso-butanediol dehydrogenase/diacetyl reductase